MSKVEYPRRQFLARTLVAVGALLFSNLVAALPGRSAARTKPGILLSEE